MRSIRAALRSALPNVGLPSSRASEVAAAPTPTVAPTEDTLAQAVAHLGYLGYEVGSPEPDGWSCARHRSRYDFHLRLVPWGINFSCGVGVGAAIENSRHAWLEFLNTANEKSRITRFSLCRDEFGAYGIRMRAFAGGDYSRQTFAIVMDLWHADLDLIRHKPDFPPEEPDDEHAAAVSVH